MRMNRRMDVFLKIFQMPGHFINEINSCVDDSLLGYVRMHSHLELAGRAVITRSPIPSVAVISGNGSGHEPAMVRYKKVIDRRKFLTFHIGWLCGSWNVSCL